MDRIEEIRERVEKMPPGPYWTKQVANGTAIKAQPRGGRGRSKDQTIALVHMHNDGEHEQTKVEFIAHAREDIGVLLERVGELEAQNEALHTALKASGERREQLERENEKLKREVEGLHAMIQQAIHPPS